MAGCRAVLCCWASCLEKGVEKKTTQTKQIEKRTQEGGQAPAWLGFPRLLPGCGRTAGQGRATFGLILYNF